MTAIRTFRNKRTGREERAVILATDIDVDGGGRLIWLVAPAYPLAEAAITPVAFGDRTEPAVALLWIWDGDWDLVPLAEGVRP